MFLSVPQIFRPGGPSLGERNMLQNCYNKVYQAVSFGLKHMDAMCFYSSVLRRLAEFEAAAGLGACASACASVCASVCALARACRSVRCERAEQRPLPS